ncbi:hypothetical protein VTL71DRAFT_5747 [Oculimacula yallundae]|uniref:Fungal N-terminal domain-containing protein n=1 Tax=Oculimacula yallundae TaxID=86028 RepID=A0ABR4BYI0_9HELO
MADPLSTAGTAVGIVSLGLQVSHGLITYYSHFKAHDEEIAYLVRKTGSLQGLLQCLESPLRKAGPGDISAQVRNSITACESGLKKLLAAAQKYGNLAIPTTGEEKLRALKKRALYPFKRSTLQDLSMTLEELLGNMQLALQILTLETNQSHRETTIALVETTTSGSRSLETHLKTMSNDLEKRFDQLILTIQAGQSHSPLYREPARLAFMCSEQQEMNSIFRGPLQAGSVRRKMPSKARNSFCSCPQYSQVIRKPAYFLGISWSQSLRHRPHCPLSRFAQHRIDTLEAKYAFCTNALGYAIAATLSVARGAGGFAISPHFMIRAVVPEESPAFRLLSWEYSDTFRANTTNYLDVADWLLQELGTLFRAGKASPTDILPDGKTLLHSATSSIYSWAYYEADRKNWLQGISRLLDGLLEFGTDPLLRDHHNRTILYYATRSLAKASHDDIAASILVKLFDCDLAIEHSGTYIFNFDREFELVHRALDRLSKEQKLGTFEVTEIEQAIWLQDEAALKNAIKSSPKSVNQPCEEGITPLHLSVLWPVGLSVLLNNKADISMCDDTGDIALFYACYHEQGPSISLLLDHDSPMGSGWNQNRCLQAVSRWKDFALQQTFVSHLVNRRKRLLQLALDGLPNFKSETLNLRSDRILDAQAASVFTELLEYRIEIASALAPSFRPFQTTVYHTPYMSLRIAKRLWEAGFRDVDAFDDNGITPFWAHILKLLSDPSFYELLDILQWLKDRGVDVYNKNQQGGGMAIHALGAGTGRDEPPEPHTVLQAGLFLADDVQDECRCACSVNGCRVVTSAIKGSTWGPWRYERPSDGERVAAIRWRCYARVLQCIKVHVVENPWMPFEIIRVLTFEWLELTHTCHKDPHDYYEDCRAPLSHEEIDEIHHEERYLLQKHEELIAEFEAMYIELGLPLETFLENHWRPRMLEVLEEKEGFDLEEERRKMRELGITVEEEDRVKELSDDEKDDDIREEEDEHEDEGESRDDVDEQHSEGEDFHDCEDALLSAEISGFES